jgi:hypothetical protein
MNRAFKVVWNTFRRQFVVTNEVKKSRRKTNSKSCMLVQLSAFLLISVGLGGISEVPAKVYCTSSGNYFILNQEGSHDYSSTAAQLDGNFSYKKYAIATAGSLESSPVQRLSIVYNPSLTLKSDDSTVLTQTLGINYIGINAEGTLTSDKISIGNISEMPENDTYGTLTLVGSILKAYAESSIAIDTKSAINSFGIYTSYLSHSFLTAGSSSGSILISTLGKSKAVAIFTSSGSSNYTYLTAKDITLAAISDNLAQGVYASGTNTLNANTQNGTISITTGDIKAENIPIHSFGVVSVESSDASNILNAYKIDIKTAASDQTLGIYTQYGTQTFNSSEFYAQSDTTAGRAYAVYTDNASVTTISSSDLISIKSSVTGSDTTKSIAYAVNAFSNSQLTAGYLNDDILGKTKKVDITSTEGATSVGISSSSGSVINVAASVLTVDASSTDTGASAVGLYVDGGTVNLSGEDITVKTQAANARGISAGMSDDEDGVTSTVTLGDDSSEKISISSTGESESIAVFALKRNASVDVKADKITIEALGTDSENTNDVIGILAQSNTEPVIAPDESAAVKITSPGAEGLIKIQSDHIGVGAFSNGQVNIDGNLIVDAEDAVYARGNATVNINTDASKSRTTVLNGDIVFGTTNTKNGDPNSSGKILNAYVNIRLSGSTSSWTGSSYSAYKIKDSETNEIRPYYIREAGANDEYFGQVTGFKLTLANGATWNATNDSFVNKLSVVGQDNKVNSNGHSLDIQELVFENGSSLETQLNVAYNVTRNDKKVVTDAAAALKVTVDGTATLLIADSVSYSISGLTALENAYKNTGLELVLENGILYVDPAETLPKAVILNHNLTVSSETKLSEATLSEDKTLKIEHSLTADKLTLKQGAQLLVGNNDVAGKLISSGLTVEKGSKILFDPIFRDGESNQSSEGAIILNGNLDGQIIVGQNSKLVIGSTDISVLNSALDEMQTSVSESLPAVLYVSQPITISSSGLLAVNGSIDSLDSEDASALLSTTGFSVAKNTALIVDASAGSDRNAIITGADGAQLTVEGNIYVDNVTAGSEFVIFAGFDEDSISQIKQPEAVSRLIVLETENGKTKASANSTIADATLAPNTLVAAVSGAAGEGAKTISSVFARTNGLTEAQAVKKYNSIALMGTASAAQAVAINSVNMINDTLDRHGSVLASYAHNKTGADLWIDLNGSFSKATRYQAGSSKYGFKSDLAGATIGADYAFGNGAAVGGAFSFGTGSARGQGNGAGIKNGIEYYGFNIYGAYSTPYVNLIGTVGYTLSKNEISQQGYKGKPDVNTFSVGIRAEKDFKVTEGFAITPHVGIRYLNVDMDNFTAGGFKYTAKKVNITEVPVGVAFNANLKAPCGADVKPFADFTIAPAMGSKKAANKFGLAGSAATDTIRSRVANSNLYQGKIGVNATQGNHSLSFSYGIGAGSDSRVDQALQAKYRYSF